MEDPVVEFVAAPGPRLSADVAELLVRLDRSGRASGLSEARMRALEQVARGPVAGFLAVAARDPGDGRLVGYAQIDREGDPHAAGLEIVVEENHAGVLFDLLLDRSADAFRDDGGGRLRLWIGHADDRDDDRAAARGFLPERSLFQMRCALPLPTETGETVPTRAFRVGADEAAWLVTNNRAFAGHPEQSDWTPSDVALREAEPWFDPEGFRVLDVDGRLAGSCWTRVHHDTDPTMGEIFVISVDPEFHGRGWGRALTRAGLDWLAAAGLTTGMLYVDAANVAAVSLYRSMGFTVHHQDRSYLADIAS